MFDAMITHPGFTLFGFTCICLLIQGVRACIRYRSWLPLLIMLATIVSVTLLGIVLGLLLRPLFV